MKTNTKILAFAAVAMFCIAAFAVAVSDDADAAESKRFNLYVEVLDSEGNVVFGQWVYATGEKTAAGYVAAMDPAIKAAMKDAKNVGATEEYGVSESSYGIRTDSDPDYWAACFSNINGKWDYLSPSSQYYETDSAAVIFAPQESYYDFFYISELPEGADASKYLFHHDDYMGDGYLLLPNTSATSYEKESSGSSSNNTMIIVCAIVVVLIIIAACAFFFMKKKKTA